MPRLDDVARAAGVSKATASRALSGADAVSPATRDKVQRVAAELGFRASGAARRLATGMTRTIGVLTPSVDRWYFGSVLHGIAHAADSHEHDVLLYDLGAFGHGGHEKFERFMRRGEVDGLVTITWSLVGGDLTRLADLGIPVATVGEPTPHTRSFCLDDDAAGELVTEHLVGLGHTDLLHLASQTEVQPFDASSADRRKRAFETVSARHRLPMRPVETVPTTLEGAHAFALEILGRDDRPTGIVAGTDEVALAVMLAAQQLGIRVPEDLSVIGIDDVPTASAFGLTTVRQDPAQHGEDVVAWIMAALHARSGSGGGPGNEPDRSHTSYAPELVVRTSTAPPRR
ncbi:LacI family DNA-binding transcriptional regulator [Agrococcus sp. ARC_14]|uniref:LacI family DNA-binding transcriptional regulator n=1 Tax=Agrococcus sp. ARC_14 TaxID=2919927 RepID=UPI001F070BC5|nr:LacI family DNA-binding transcriptional regulator [Agrococcus sp. ARC_14]MCH1881666.1 LacI family transcriptional regulator [Agrococcus sp. ARC_14]